MCEPKNSEKYLPTSQRKNGSEQLRDQRLAPIAAMA